MNGSSKGASNGGKQRHPKVVIVGAGLGGLTCAIQCRREELDVLVLEKESALHEVGAGIQLPPNAARVMQYLGVLEKLRAAGMSAKEQVHVLRWNGDVITSAPGDRFQHEKYGPPSHYLIHRADYQRVLADEASRLGVELRLSADVESADCSNVRPSVTLRSGEKIEADVIVGADGLRSSVRDGVLGYLKPAEETNDMAYRVTIPREALDDETDELLRSVLDERSTLLYLGGDHHVVCYTIRDESLVNLVFICPDDLPAQVSRQRGEMEEMRERLRNWDPRITAILKKVEKPLKWKIWGMEELNVWVKGSAALLGDACHPSTPYLAQGAAQAVEDGFILGRLLGQFSHSGHSLSSLPELLQLYQELRKQRAVSVVKAADSMGVMYHLPDGPEQEERDRLLRNYDFWKEEGEMPFALLNVKTMRGILAFDALKNADEGFARRFGAKC